MTVKYILPVFPIRFIRLEYRFIVSDCIFILFRLHVTLRAPRRSIDIGKNIITYILLISILLLDII